MSDTLPESIRTLVIKPGDKLLFHVGTEIQDFEGREWSRQIEKALPGVPFLIVSGDVEVSVIREEDES